MTGIGLPAGLAALRQAVDQNARGSANRATELRATARAACSEAFAPARAMLAGLRAGLADALAPSPRLAVASGYPAPRAVPARQAVGTGRTARSSVAAAFGEDAAAVEHPGGLPAVRRLAGPRPGPRPSPRPGPADSSRPSRPPALMEPSAQDDARPGAGPSPRERVPTGSASITGIVASAQAGDAEAFGELYDRYVELVFRYIYYRVGGRALAEDLTSETFLRALRRIAGFTWQGRDVGAWLVTIARNLVTDHYKSARYRLEITTADMLDADRATEGPEGAVLEGLASETLLAAVKRLNSEQQECIALRFLQGLSVAETAAAMDKKEGAIKALQYRAVRTLGRLLPNGMTP